MALSRNTLRLVLLAPAFLLIAVFILLPVIVNLWSSLTLNGSPTLEHFRTFLSRGQYLASLWNTLSFALLTAALSLILAFPAAAFFSTRGPLVAGLFLGTLGVSFVISGLIRIFSWQLLLSRFGALNGLFDWAGIDLTVEILYSRTAVILSMVQIMIPYAAAILFSGMRNIDREIIFAARTLGASEAQVLTQSYLPQIRTSIVNAFLVVFVLSTGFFVAPVLLGGPKDTVLGTVMLKDLNMNFQTGQEMAATTGVILTLVLVIATTLALIAAGRPYRRPSRS